MRLAERHHLSITIRPDGSIVGLPADLKKLRLLLERRSKAKNKVQRSKKRLTREELFKRSLLSRRKWAAARLQSALG